MESPLNVDGSVSRNSGLLGFCGLIRDHEGSFLRISMVILIPLVYYMLEFLHFTMVWICVGRLVFGVLFVFKDFGNLISLIKKLLSQEWIVDLCHTLRKDNSAVDSLAKIGFKIYEKLVILDTTHPDLSSYVVCRCDRLWDWIGELIVLSIPSFWAPLTLRWTHLVFIIFWLVLGFDPQRSRHWSDWTWEDDLLDWDPFCRGFALLSSAADHLESFSIGGRLCTCTCSEAQVNKGFKKECDLKYGKKGDTWPNAKHVTWYSCIGARLNSHDQLVRTIIQ